MGDLQNDNDQVKRLCQKLQSVVWRDLGHKLKFSFQPSDHMPCHGKVWVRSPKALYTGQYTVVGEAQIKALQLQLIIPGLLHNVFTIEEHSASLGLTSPSGKVSLLLENEAPFVAGSHMHLQYA